MQLGSAPRPCPALPRYAVFRCSSPKVCMSAYGCGTRPLAGSLASLCHTPPAMPPATAIPGQHCQIKSANKDNNSRSHEPTMSHPPSEQACQGSSLPRLTYVYACCRVWNLQSGRQLCCLQGHRGRGIWRCLLHPDQVCHLPLTTHLTTSRERTPLEAEKADDIVSWCILLIDGTFLVEHNHASAWHQKCCL